MKNRFWWNKLNRCISLRVLKDPSTHGLGTFDTCVVFGWPFCVSWWFFYSFTWVVKNVGLVHMSTVKEYFTNHIFKRGCGFTVLWYWIHYDYDMCLKIDTCHDRSGSSTLEVLNKSYALKRDWLSGVFNDFCT